jgi:hypothetical protein
MLYVQKGYRSLQQTCKTRLLQCGSCPRLHKTFYCDLLIQSQNTWNAYVKYNSTTAIFLSPWPRSKSVSLYNDNLARLHTKWPIITANRPLWWRYTLKLVPSPLSNLEHRISQDLSEHPVYALTAWVYHWGKSAFSFYTYHGIIHVIHVCYMESASIIKHGKCWFYSWKDKKMRRTKAFTSKNNGIVPNWKVFS